MAPFQSPAAVQTASIKAPHVAIYYPRIVGLADQSVEKLINQTIHELALTLQQEQNKVQSGTLQEMLGHYEIKTNERGILSLILSNYAYSSPMAHGFTIARSLTFDINSGKEYALQDLFKPGADYISIISAQVSAQLKQRDLPLLDGFTSIAPNQDYYLADKALVIYFQLYEITPYYVGFPMFPISIYDLQSITAEAGPLSVLAADIV